MRKLKMLAALGFLVIISVFIGLFFPRLPRKTSNIMAKESANSSIYENITKNSEEPEYLKQNYGLFAYLNLKNEVDLKQLGAVGDGVSDDSEYLKYALSLGVSSIVIPEGTFNLYGKEIVVPSGVTIKGKDMDKSVLCNLNFTVPYGLKISNLTCTGAATRNIATTSGNYSATAMFNTSPVGVQNVSFVNCVFSNADFISFARGDNGSFRNDTVKGCSFINIGRCAIYHSVNAKSSSYTNNTFSGIGNGSLVSGPISAIWVGDVTNVTFVKTDKIEIKNNSMENLYTGNDFNENSKHAVNANFISIRADKAVISGNTIKNLMGYGHDREAVYTKVRELTIDGNTIENGGSGEAYICNKGTAGKTKTVISNNKLSGDFGAGIIVYGTAKITNNSIDIAHCKAGVITGSRDDQEGDWPLEISGNTISSTSGASYTTDGHTIADYSSGNVIKIIGPTRKVSVTGNMITFGTNCKSVISVGNAQQDVTIDNNVMTLTGLKGSGISVYGNKDVILNPSQSIQIRDNAIAIDAGQRAVNLNFNESNSARSIIFEGNSFTF
jgi:hypothetical protein